MLKEEHGSQENQESTYAGTIIDIETVGNYLRGYPKHDSREYRDLTMVVFGYINRQEWHVYCAARIEYVPELEEKARQLLTALRNQRPLYAFNCHQEMAVFFHQLNERILIDKELQSTEYEPKEEALRKLGIVESYGDPFHTDRKPGAACMRAWERGYFDKAIQHNRACLLKEQALLLHGRGKEPIALDFKIEADPPMGLSASFQPWTREQENYVRKAWREGNTLRTIAQDCRRTPNAIWMRLQRLKEIPTEVPYSIEKNFFTTRDLQY